MDDGVDAAALGVQQGSLGHRGLALGEARGRDTEKWRGSCRDPGSLRPAVPRLFQCSEQSMRLVLLCAPGSGKGKQAASLEAHLPVPHDPTGDITSSEVTASSPAGRTPNG